MKRSEILESLQRGELVRKETAFKFKHGKLQRGTFYNFYIGEEKIKENQFDAIREKIIKDTDLCTHRTEFYRLKA